MKKATMNDIAKFANVSQPTVSRVINNHPNVNDDVRKRVQDAITKLNYIPNKAAQTLKNSASHIIGVSITDISNPYFTDLIAELESEARKNGYSILLHNSGSNPLTELDNINNFLSRQVDGMIFVPTSDYNYDTIKSIPIPTIAITMPVESLDSVYLNHNQGGCIAADYLIRQGHTKFAVLGDQSCLKIAGFINELEMQGLPFDRNNFIELTGPSRTRFHIRESIRKYISDRTNLDFTAIFCSNDSTAWDFMQVAMENGIKVPDDVAVIGFDDTLIAKINRITSIHQPLSDMARLSIKILMDRITQNISSDPVQIQMPASIVTRNSTAIKIKN